MEPRGTATGKGLHALAKDGQCTTLNSMADGYAQSEECAQSGNVWEDSTPLLPTAVKRRYTFHTQPKWLSYTWSHEVQLQAKVCTHWQRMDSARHSTAWLMVMLSLRSVHSLVTYGRIVHRYYPLRSNADTPSIRNRSG